MRKEKIRLTLDEKLKQGFSKKYKLLIPAGFLFLFFMLLFMSKTQHKEHIKKDTISVSYQVQRDAYNSYQLALEGVEKEGDKKFPKKNEKIKENKDYNKFYTKYMNQANYNIEQYYHIDTKTLAKIIIKGDDKSWPVIKPKKQIIE